MFSTWCAELKRWAPSLRVVKLHSSDPTERERLRSRVLEEVGSYDVVVTTYEMVKSAAMRPVLVQKLHWRLVRHTALTLALTLSTRARARARARAHTQTLRTQTLHACIHAHACTRTQLVLDEGHVLKNAETEISQTVRKMHFVHALLLTGTPLQNNLTELWCTAPRGRPTLALSTHPWLATSPGLGDG